MKGWRRVSVTKILLWQYCNELKLPKPVSLVVVQSKDPQLLNIWSDELSLLFLTLFLKTNFSDLPPCLDANHLNKQRVSGQVKDYKMLHIVTSLIPRPCADGTTVTFCCWLLWWHHNVTHIYRDWLHPTSLDPRDKTISLELGSNPGPLALQATAQSVTKQLLGDPIV